MNPRPTHLRLFLEFLKIATFVVGGGWVIALVSDERFGKRLGWLKEGELLDHLPILQSVPGLIAGNTAIYTGLRLLGRTGALVGLLGVALPSLVIFLIVSCAFDSIPRGAPCLEGAFAGLRAALTGIMGATIWKTCRRPLPDWSKGTGIRLAPLSVRQRLFLLVGLVLGLAAAAALCAEALVPFLGFGLVCVGGGFPLIPFYDRIFVGPAALLLGMPPEKFGDLMALTQMTPGPISVNAATFFGYNLGGIAGACIATGALLLPSFFLLTAVLGGLERYRNSRLVRFILRVLRPASVGLMLVALLRFASMSIWRISPLGHCSFHPLAALLALAAAVLILRGKCPVLAIVAVSACCYAAAMAFGLGN